jgi:hypothetical protein
LLPHAEVRVQFSLADSLTVGMELQTTQLQSPKPTQLQPAWMLPELLATKYLQLHLGSDLKRN